MSQTALALTPQPTASVQIRTPLASLHIHPAHDRTRYDLDRLTGLTMQVVQRDLDTWQPVTAARLTAVANGSADNIDTEASSPKFAIISGHRRWLARVLAYGVQEWAQLPQYAERIEAAGGIELAFVRELLTEIVCKLGDVPAADTASSGDRLTLPKTLSASAVHGAVGKLLQLYGDREITIAEFSGGVKAQVLALQAANANREDPDPLGLARSYKAAFEAGATPAEIARHSGVHTDYILNHLALTQVHPELAEAIAADRLPMGMARQIAKQEAPLRDGVAAFVLSTLQNDNAATVSGIKAALKRLRKWSGIQAPLAGLHRQSQRNVARILAALWQKTVSADASRAWSAAVAMAYADHLDDPWLDGERTVAWFRLLDRDRSYLDANNRPNWPAIVRDLLLPVSCDTCAIGQLPREKLQSDIGEGRDGVTGIPCRLHAAGEHEKCLHGYAPDDPLQIPVPFDWGTHPGVVRENGGYVVKSAETLRTAWNTQRTLEVETIASADVPVTGEDVGNAADPVSTTAPLDAVEAPMGSSAESTASAERSESVQPGSKVETVEHPSAVTSTQSAEKQSKGDSKTQSRIRKYMTQAPTANVAHPFATSCATCRHKLEVSPVKSKPDAPPCTWSKGNRALSFTELNATDPQVGFQPILVCRQYAPAEEWRDRIPTHPGTLPLPRSWYVAQIETFATEMAEANRVYGGHTAQIAQYPLEFLTGRPVGGTDSHADWFRERFAAEQGNLADGQIFTLFVWLLTERRRMQKQAFLLPVNGSTAQFVEVRERAVIQL